MTQHFFQGLQYVIDGFQLITKPGLKRFVIIPVLINIVLFLSLFALSQHYFGQFNHWLTLHLPHWLAWLSGVLWLVFFIGFLFVMLYTFVTLANIFAAPFNSLLAEKVEYYLTGIKHEQSYIALLKDIPRIIGRQLAILGYYLPRAIFCLILFFIPIVQLVAAIMWFLFNAWFMTLQYIDYPTDINHIPLKKIRTQLKQKSGLSFGFGIGVLTLTMIPILNFFVIPAAVAGATKLWIEKFKGN